MQNLSKQLFNYLNMAILLNLKTLEKLMNKNKLIFIGLGLTSLLTYAMASVPHTFSANTVAKASEVNDNFSSLDNRITALENNSISQNKNDSSSSATTYENCDKSVFTYEYKYIASNIGDEITIGTDKYKIIAVPFEEFTSKEHYYIKLPAYVGEEGEVRFDNFRISYDKIGTSCYPDNIKGFPAKISNPSYDRYYTILKNYNSDTGKSEKELKISDWSYGSVQIKINQTTLHIYTSMRTKLQSINASDSKDDFRNDIDWQKLNIQNQLPEQVKFFLNHIDIVKIEN